MTITMFNCDIFMANQSIVNSDTWDVTAKIGDLTNNKYCGFSNRDASTRYDDLTMG